MHRSFRTVGASVLLMLLSLPVAFARDAAYDQLPKDRVLYIAPGQSVSALVERLYRAKPDQLGRDPRLDRQKQRARLCWW